METRYSKVNLSLCLTKHHAMKKIYIATKRELNKVAKADECSLFQREAT